LTSYNLTPEHFARARADIDRRRKELMVSHEAALATIAGHELATQALDDERDEVEECERTAASIAERYSDAAAPPSTKRRKAKRRPNTGRPYKPTENERIVAAERGTLEALAEDLGRDYPGVLKQHEVLLRQQREPENAETALAAQEARSFDESLPQRMEEYEKATEALISNRRP